MSEHKLTVHINQLENVSELTEADVEAAVLAAARAESVGLGEISVTFCGADEIADLNRTYLDRDRPTDVIAFNLGEPGEPLGDVYICPVVARRSALEYDVPPREELLRLVVHGALHILGYDHPEGEERADSEMFRVQERILSGLGARLLSP